MSNYIVVFSTRVTHVYGREHHGAIAREESKLKGGTSVRKRHYYFKEKTNCYETSLLYIVQQMLMGAFQCSYLSYVPLGWSPAIKVHGKPHDLGFKNLWDKFLNKNQQNAISY